MRSVKDAIAYGLQKAQYKDVREHQRKVIEGYCSGKDVFLSAPTGSGKSLTFEVAPYVFDYLEHGERLEVCSVCLVVVPLVALMKDQVGADCTREQVKEISEGKYSLVFGSPEALLNSHRSIFHGKLRKNISLRLFLSMKVTALQNGERLICFCLRYTFARLQNTRSPENFHII